MRHVQRFIRFAGAAAVIVLCGSAAAQSSHSYRLFCHPIGGALPEPLGDREGHALLAGQSSCRVEGGPLGGAVLTGMVIWEIDGSNAVALFGSGVYRKPGATAVHEILEAKGAVTVADGKVTGVTLSGRGVYKLATGSAASLMGKTYSYTSTSTGEVPYFTVDVKVD